MTDNVTKTRNRARREKYQTDEAYRQQVNQANNEAYRRDNDVKFRDSSSNLGLLNTLGTMRTLVGEEKEIMTFTASEVAEVLGDYSKQSVYRWLREGQLPEMVYVAVDFIQAKTVRRAEVKVYTYPEMAAVLQILSVHQKNYSYFTRRHKDVIENLASTVAKIRG